MTEGQGLGTMTDLCQCSDCTRVRNERLARKENTNKEEGKMSEAITEMTQQDVPVDERVQKLGDNITVENGIVKVRINGLWQLASIGSLSMATEVSSLTDWQITSLEELLEANKIIQTHHKARIQAQDETAELRRQVMDEVETMWEGHSGHMNIDEVNAALDRMGLDPLQRKYDFTVTYFVERSVTLTVEASDEDEARDRAVEDVKEEYLSYGESAYDEDSWDIQEA